MRSRRLGRLRARPLPHGPDGRNRSCRRPKCARGASALQLARRALACTGTVAASGSAQGQPRSQLRLCALGRESVAWVHHRGPRPGAGALWSAPSPEGPCY